MYDKETVYTHKKEAHTCTHFCTCVRVSSIFYMYIDMNERERGREKERVRRVVRGAAGGRVAMMLKRDGEHSDWPIVVQRSDNAGNWPSLDKTAK